MKLNSLRLAFVLAATGAALSAAPLSQTTAVFAKPDATTAPVAVLKAGSEPVLAPDTPAPAGWVAVSLAGPHKVYAANKDISKALQVHAGAPYRTEPKADAPIIALAADGDKAEISGLHGRWTEFKLTKTIIGYIKSSASPVVAAPKPVAAPAVSKPETLPAPAAAPTDVAPAAAIVIPGKPAPMGDGGSSALPRLFQGKLVSTYSAFRPRRPYDYQLNDAGGERYAYLDVSKLLATEQFNSYLDRTVVVYGTAKAVPGTKDVVILVESLQLH
ncbi:MAG TPA: hypothetical protein VL357_07380 [Rariglobus sp.]|jgi:hypothetical protein|nr:hypothetical protein [Rariglobus sp.]